MNVKPGAAPDEPDGVQVRLKNIALFFAGPFITLSHLVMLPVYVSDMLKQRAARSKDARLS
jgi:hypothetical protein